MAQNNDIYIDQDGRVLVLLFWMVVALLVLNLGQLWLDVTILSRLP